MRAAPLARRTLTTLEAKAGASSGNNASSSPGEIKRWAIMMPGQERASIADSSEGSTVTIILGRVIGLVGGAHVGASEHATLGSTILPAIDRSHGAAVILSPVRAN
jgi:hypothetical protein